MNHSGEGVGGGGGEGRGGGGHGGAGGSKPYNLNPTTYTLHPTPFTLNPQPSNLNPQPATLNPQPSTLNPTPHTLHPNPSALEQVRYAEIDEEGGGEGAPWGGVLGAEDRESLMRLPRGDQIQHFWSPISGLAEAKSPLPSEQWRTFQA